MAYDPREQNIKDAALIIAAFIGLFFEIAFLFSFQLAIRAFGTVWCVLLIFYGVYRLAYYVLRAIIYRNKEN